jgi:iron complex outermembrane recepter protein
VVEVRCARAARLLALATLASVALAPSAAAQGGTLSGRVVRASSDSAIAGADVTLRSSGARVETDSAGRFAFRDVPAGPAEITVRRLGFAPVDLHLAVPAGSAAEVTIPLTAVVTTLEVITTTATADPRSVADVPAAISIADTVAIRQGRSVGLNETLRMMPGVQAASRFGTDDVNIGIRGSASRARQAIRGVALLLDGVALSEADGVARTDLVELLAAERIEVVRGPVSALYAGSAGGVVNVISQSGLTNPGLSARAEFGPYGFEKLYGSAGSGLHGGKGSVLAAGSYTYLDGYREHSNGGIGRGQVRGSYQAASRTVVSADAELSSMNTVLPGQLTETQFNADPNAAQPAAVAFNFGRDEDRFRVGARLDQGLNASGSTSATAYYYYGGRTFDFRFGGPAPGILNANFHRSQFGAQLNAASVGGGPVGLIAGMTYDNVFGTDVRWSNVLGHKGPMTDDGYDRGRNLGIFGQAEWSVSRAVTLTAGLRYDDVAFHFESYFPGWIPEQDRTYSQWSPRTTLSWRTGGELLYASVSRGFEVPAFGEISPSPGDTLELLNPKSLWNYEVGARGLLARQLQFDVSVFLANITGEFIPVDRAGNPEIENASKSRNFGVELSLLATVTRWLSLSGTYAYSDFRLLDYVTNVTDSAGGQRPVDESGNILPAVPQNRVTVAVQAQPLRGLSIGLQVEWQSLMYVESGNQLSGTVYFKPGPVVLGIPFSAVPARALVALNAQYQVGPVGLFGAVENLFGISYVGNVVANAGNGAFYEAGPGRWITIGVRMGTTP